MSDFPFPVFTPGQPNYTTKYDLDVVPNEVMFKCGKYTIKRKETTATVYKININLYDVLNTDADTIITFYNEKHQSEHFSLALDGYSYYVLFTSFKVEPSNLIGRKNISFSVIGNRPT